MNIEVVEQDYTIVRGNTFTITTTVRDTDGNIIDLTDYDAYFTLRNDYLDLTEDPLLTITGTISSPTTGVLIINILPTNTDSLELTSYYYDIVITNGSNNNYTLYKGLFSLTYNITN